MRLGFVITLAVCSALGLSACATSDKIKARQIGDTSLSCDDIAVENKKLDKVEQDIAEKKGLTGTNVAAALFWLPGLFYTYYDADHAEERVSDRRSWLVELHEAKEC